jgi:Hormone receptor domain.
MLGITWPQTAPDIDAIQDCPIHYTGVARRRCSLRNTFRTKWEMPNFSSCISDSIEHIYNKVSSKYEYIVILRFFSHSIQLFAQYKENIIF